MRVSFCVRVCRVDVSRCRCAGKWPGVRGTNLGAEDRMRGRDLVWGLKWELVVGEFVCGPCLRGWDMVCGSKENFCWPVLKECALRKNITNV